MEDDGDVGFSRIPLSNEIVLRGHTKVLGAICFCSHLFSGFLSCCYTDVTLYLDLHYSFRVPFSFLR
jgi:hypothetical protein